MTVESFTIPGLLKKELEYVPKTGYYSSTSEFLRDAIRNLFEKRRDVKMAVAIELYRDGEVSLGKAAEMVGLGYDEMKTLLADRGVKLVRGPKTVSEMKEGSKALRELAG
jgi:predicted HTH domain antitoxin